MKNVLPRIHLIKTKTTQLPIVLYFLNSKVAIQCPMCKGPCSLPIGKQNPILMTGHRDLKYIYLRKEDFIEVEYSRWNDELKKQFIALLDLMKNVYGSYDKVSIYIVINDVGNGKYGVGTVASEDRATNTLSFSFNHQITRILSLKAFW